MAPLTDPIRLAAYRNALANWRFRGYILWTEPAERWIRRELSNLTTQEFGRLMHEHVLAGGIIDAVVEKRPEWAEHQFHYDLRLEIEDRDVYIETRLIVSDPDDPDDPIIHVVSVHDP